MHAKFPEMELSGSLWLAPHSLSMRREGDVPWGRRCGRHEESQGSCLGLVFFLPACCSASLDQAAGGEGAGGRPDSLAFWRGAQSEGLGVKGTVQTRPVGMV